MGGAEIYPSRSHYDIDDDVGRVEQNEEVNSSRDYDQLMKQDRIRRALSTAEQGRERPSRVWTRPSRFLKGTDLCSFAIVALEDAAEFALATNDAFGCRNEGMIKDSVVPTDPTMRSLLMIMFEPHANDVVELSSTEANEVVQHLAFGGAYKALHEGVCLRCSGRDTNASDLWFPELIEFVWILPVTISNY